MVRAQEAWPPVGISWFAFELVRPPFGIPGRRISQGAFENDFVPDLADAAESPVRIDQLERLKGRVHPLLAREEVGDRLDAQGSDADRQNRSRGSLRSRRDKRARLTQK